MKAPDPQLELHALAQPRELTVTGDDLAPTVARIEARGGIIQAWERVPGCNGQWRLEIFWPRCSCELCAPPPLPSSAAAPMLDTADDAPRATPEGKAGHSSKESL